MKRLFFCVIAGAMMAGCAETPRQTLRPIPPPPSTPPPGVAVTGPVMVIPPGTAITNAPVTVVTNYTAAVTNTVAPPASMAGMEVSSNFQAGAQSPQAPPGAAAPGPQATVLPGTAPGVPQYEVVPEQPGPDYVWMDGYWAWQGAGWAWVPGRWVWRPEPRIMIMPGPGYWGYRHHYYYGPRYRHWR